MKTIPHDSALAVAIVKAIHQGDVARLERLLAEDPTLASASIRDRKGGRERPAGRRRQPGSPGSIINGGAPLNNAVACGQFNAARRLVDRGAKTEPWHAAPLELFSQVQEYFGQPPLPTPQVVNELFWNACRGGHRPTVEFLLTRGADPNAIPPQSQETPLDIALTETPGRPSAPELVAWLKSLGDKTAYELKAKE